VSALSALLAAVFALPIRVYRWVLSPLLPPSCRYHPSCSVYALQALKAHGPFTGLYLAARRLSRCHPFHDGGLDPVPPPRARAGRALLKRT
jgi:putative membrane protein insertion efficiency factor